MVNPSRVKFGLAYNHFLMSLTKKPADLAICYTSNLEQIDLIKFEFLPMFKEYYLDRVLVKNKKDKWIYER